MIKYFALIFIITSCQDFNSNTLDKSLYGGVELPTDASDDLISSYQILQIRCMSCHADWNAYTNDQDWIDSNLVYPGSVVDSSLITRIRNYGGGQSDMPTNTGPLPAAEYTILLNWVENL